MDPYSDQSHTQHRDGKVPSPRQKKTPIRSHIRMRERGTGPGGRSRAVGARSVAPGRLVGVKVPEARNGERGVWGGGGACVLLGGLAGKGCVERKKVTSSYFFLCGILWAGGG